jgi:hypothetical protein
MIKLTTLIEDIYFENQQLNENLIINKLTEYWNKLKSTLNNEDLKEIEKKINSMTEQQKIETINNNIKELEISKFNKFLIEFWDKFKFKINGSILNIITLIIASSIFLQSCEIQKYYTYDKIKTRDAYNNKPGDVRPSTRYNPKKHKHYRIRWNKFQPGSGITYYW